MANLFANSGEPDQMPHIAASDLGLHYLPITLLGVSKLQWANVRVPTAYFRGEIRKYLYTSVKKKLYLEICQEWQTAFLNIFYYYSDQIRLDTSRESSLSFDEILNIWECCLQ